MNNLIQNWLNFNKPVPFLVILLFSCMLWGGQYARRDLWEPDEARYTYVAKEMKETGNWFIPQRNGEFYTHKPPLMFWMIQLSSVFTGGKLNGISGRLPSFIGILLSLWVIARFASMWFDHKTGWWACLIVSTSSLFWQKGGMGQIDMLLLGLELVALYCLLESEYTSRYTMVILAFVFMGLAILAKGPVGLAIPLGIYLCINGFSKTLRRIRYSRLCVGVCIAFLFPALWLILAKLNHAPVDFFQELLFAQNIGRVTGEFGGHSQPVYYYLPYLFIDFLPWTCLTPLAIIILLEEKSSALSFRSLLAWIGFVLCFFSLIGSKRNLYILSVYPALSLILAASIPKWKSVHVEYIKYSTIPLYLVLILMTIAGIIAGPIAPMLHKKQLIDIPIFLLLPLSLVLGIGTIILIRLEKKQGISESWFGTLIGILFIIEIYIGMVIFPAFNIYKTPVALASVAQEKIPKNHPLLLYQINGEILALYSDRQGKRIEDPDTMRREIEKNQKGIAVFPKEHWEKLSSSFSSFGTVHDFYMGKKHFYWLEYNTTQTSP
ncbi:MAG: glycosyltransferase family 39 protein [Desulfobacterales bacterium]|nr:glycosyltransferase family 39 protein [Desulfobacterales bacterium]